MPNVVVRVENRSSADLCDVASGGDIGHWPDIGRLRRGETARTLGTYGAGGVWVSFRRCEEDRWHQAVFEDYVMRWSVHDVVITDGLEGGRWVQECVVRCARPVSGIRW